MTGSPLKKRALWAGTALALICVFGVVPITVASAAAPLKKGLKVFVIPKNLGNPYFTTSDSVKSGGAIAALQALGETGTETSGTAATAGVADPGDPGRDHEGRERADRVGHRRGGALPDAEVGDEEGDHGRHLRLRRSRLPQPVHQPGDARGRSARARSTCSRSRSASSGEIAIVSAAASATNQNAWIGFMKKELKKYPKMKLVSIVYGNDDPTVSTQVTQGLLQQYPNLKGIISPTTVGIAAAAAVLDTAQYRGKVKLTGLGTPNSLRKYVNDGTIEGFELWNPADLGYLAAYAGVELASGTITGKTGQTFTAGKLGKFKVGAGHSVLLGPPFVFNKANIAKFNF